MQQQHIYYYEIFVQFRIQDSSNGLLDGMFTIHKSSPHDQLLANDIYPLVDLNLKFLFPCMVSFIINNYSVIQLSHQSFLRISQMHC